MNHQNNIFKNSCIRDKINHGILQPQHLTTLGYAIGYILAQEFEMSCPILVATDTRTSGTVIKQALIQGMIDLGHDVFDAGIAPTPAVAKALKDYQPEEEDDDRDSSADDEQDEDENYFTLGIVITASHNPAEYNGLKILTPFGYLDEEIELEISDIFHKLSAQPSLIDELLNEHDEEPGVIIDFDLRSWYQSEVIEEFSASNFNSSVLIDCAHGATTQIAPTIFQACGFSIKTINNSSDGSKINHNSGCSNPETLLTAIAEHKTEWACAFDGDGDRVLIAHKNGTIFDGDDIIAVIAQHNRYTTNSVIVGTIMTNLGLEEYLKKIHKKLIRTNVGERNIITALMQRQAFLGSEACGHITMMDHAFCSDGIFAALMFFDAIAHNKALSEKLYQKYPQVHATIQLSNRTISDATIEQIVTKNKQQDVRIVARLSNTEPILRIMVEAETQANAQTILQNIHDQFIKELTIKK